MTALETHGHELETKYYTSSQTDPYKYCSELANFLSLNLQYLVQHHEDLTDPDMEILKKLLSHF